METEAQWVLKVPSITWFSKSHNQLKDGRIAAQRGTQFINDHRATCGQNSDENSSQNSGCVLGSYCLSQMPLPPLRSQETVKVMGLVGGGGWGGGSFSSRFSWALAL